MIPILCGTQNGNGLHLAKLLEKEYKDTFFTLVIDEFDIMKINEFDFIIFIVSTHGDGQCTFNMSKFWNVLTSDLPKIFKFKYVVLCLGNSKYPKYNWCGKITYNRLEQLGAIPLGKVLCNTQDKNGNYDGYNKFKRMLNSLDVLGPSLNGINSRDKIKEIYEKYRIKTKKYTAKIISNKLVTREGYEKCVIEIIFEIPDYDEFEPGCCIGIMPLAKCKELKKYKLTDLEIEWLEKNVDLYAPPHQTIFKVLADIVFDKKLKNKLLEIFSEYELYHSYVVVAKRNIFEILDDFGIKQIEFGFLKELKKITMRYYSASLINGKYHILASLAEYKTYLKKTRKGLCSEYLKDLSGKIEVEMGPGKLCLTNNKLLFFSTGSGITLPRSVKHYYKDKEIKVFYGFRGYEDDLLCKNEFEKNEIYYAASVDDKKHVMDVFRANPVENIDEWTVLVSGNTRINKEINKLMKEIYNKEVFFQSETW